MIAESIVSFATGYVPIIVLSLLVVVTMTLSDVLNNTVTTVISHPSSNRLGVSADPFLMAVAVATSCAFLTPIGHKNNTLIIGPGGYGLGDYWRMGLPLEIIAVSIPMIIWVWPF